MPPGKTEAGSAGTQPCPGIARCKLIEDDDREDGVTRRPPAFSCIGFDRFAHALKIPARRAALVVTKTGLTPIPAEPRHDEKEFAERAAQIQEIECAVAGVSSKELAHRLISL